MKFTRELLVGAVFLLAMAVMVVAVVVTRSDEFKPVMTQRIWFATAGGLERGGKVLVSGVSVGNVSDIRLEGTEALVTINFRQAVELYDDAKFFIDVPLALAKPSIIIDPGSPSSGPLTRQPLRGDTAPNVMQKLGPILPDVAATVAETRKTIEAINAGKGALGALIHDESLVSDLRDTVASLRKVSLQIEQGKGALGILLNDETLATDLRDTIASLKKVSSQIEQGKGALGVLVNDEAAGKELADAIASIKRITTQAEEGRGLLGALLYDETLAGQFETIVTDVNEVTRGLRAGEGTIGRLLRDDAVFNEIASLLKRLNDSLEDAREQAPISSFTSVLLGSLR